MNERQALEASIIELTGRLASLSDAQKAELDKFKAELRMLKAEAAMLEAKEAMLKAEAAMLDARKKLEDDPVDPQKIARFAKAEQNFEFAREHYYEMCRLWGVLATPVQQAAATAVGSQGFVVRGTVGNAWQTNQARKYVYLCAQDCLGYYVEGVKDKKTIFYPANEDGMHSSDLSFCVLFKTDDWAHKFYNMMSNFTAAREVRVEIPDFYVPFPARPIPIVSTQYDAAEFDSITRDGTESYTSAGSVAEDIKAYQCVETMDILMGGEKAHIKPRADCGGDEASDPNNLLYLSMYLHKALDATPGYVATGAPLVNLFTSGEVVKTLEDGAVGKTRSVVHLDFICRDERSQQSVSQNVKWKAGMIYLPDTRTYRVEVAVEDPVKFAGYVSFRNQQTAEWWANGTLPSEQPKARKRMKE